MSASRPRVLFQINLQNKYANRLCVSAGRRIAAPLDEQGCAVMAQWACYVALGMASASAALPVGLAVMARADTLNSALISAYQNNPQLNSQRAVVRETDESVPQALSGYRPSVSVTGQFGPGYSSIVSKDVGPTGAPIYPRTSL